jgi:hypothetical protein
VITDGRWQLAAPEAVSSLFQAAKALDTTLCQRLSPPFLVALPPEWESSRHRVLVYGQETNGWAERSVPQTLAACVQSSASIEGLRAHYEGFDFATYYSHRQSPFWAACRQLAAHLEQGDRRKLIWSNLIKVDAGPCVDSGTKSVLRVLPAAQIEQILSWQQTLLLEEVSDIAPSAVLFLTGPRYDGVLTQTLAAEIAPVKGFDPRLISRVISPNLPPASFRTYHPAFLRRTRQWSVLDDIAAIIKVERSERVA